MATTEHGMTTTEATILTTAAEVLGELERDATAAAWGASSGSQGTEPKAQDYGRMSEACERAADAIHHVLVVGEVHCSMPAARAANERGRR
jgi:hypothetical protein